MVSETKQPPRRWTAPDSRKKVYDELVHAHGSVLDRIEQTSHSAL